MTDKTDTTALVIAEELNEWARDYVPTELATALATCAAVLLKKQNARIAELEALQAAPPAPVEHVATLWVEENGCIDFETSPFFMKPPGEYQLYTATPAPAAVPVLYVSPAQLEKHLDLEGAENAEAGRYLPARKTPAGKFTQPLYALAAAPAQTVALPAEVELPDVEDMAHGAVQEALSFGVNHDVFHRWMRAVMGKTVQALAAAPAQEHANQLAGPGGTADAHAAWSAFEKLESDRGAAEPQSNLVRDYLMRAARVGIYRAAAPAQAQEDGRDLEAPEAVEVIGYRISDPCEPDLGFWLSEETGAAWCKSEALTLAAPAAPAVDARDARDAAFEAVRNRLCGLQRYSFVLDDDGVVRRAQDRSGNWIEFDDAHELFDPVAVDAAIDAARAAQVGDKP